MNADGLALNLIQGQQAVEMIRDQVVSKLEYDCQCDGTCYKEHEAYDEYNIHDEYMEQVYHE